MQQSTPNDRLGQFDLVGLNVHGRLPYCLHGLSFTEQRHGNGPQKGRQTHWRPKTVAKVAVFELSRRYFEAET